MQNHPTVAAPEWTIAKLIKWTTSYFQTQSIDSPRTDAEILLAHVLNLNRIDLYLRYDQPLSQNELAQFKTLIKRRINREPVAYIVGVKEFWSMDLAVTKDVLIPRPETECLVETALSLLPEDTGSEPTFTSMRVLELGTGSGAIVIALAAQRREHRFFASDRSSKAVEMAVENAKRHGLDQKIKFFCGDWLNPMNNSRHGFDMILSNPPYIRSREVDRLQPEIFMYEPLMALDGGGDGLDCLRCIIESAHTFLKAYGSLLLEIDHDQRAAVKKIIDSCQSYENITFKKDYSGYDRIVRMQKKHHDQNSGSLFQL
ncbi:MAG: peptide chain release factor N(5)-glutamine methyltransferase [Proteobacteria bacterium]|nr:peptide chain release factor N(5)-glutamine methyltransferase [Pseudomonadota bacterium]